MEYDIELTDVTVEIGRVKFYDANFEEEEGCYFFHGSSGRHLNVSGVNDYLIDEEIIFEIWITDGEVEWGEGVDPSPRKKSLTPDEQNLLIKNLIDGKEDYINDFGDY